MFKTILILFVCLTSVGYADSYKSDIIGEGSITSDVRFGGLGTHVRVSSGEFAVGNQLISGETNLLFSGLELVDGVDGNYRVWGKIGDTSHSINIKKATEILALSTIKTETNVLDDNMDEPLETVETGSSSMNITFTGQAVEKVRSISERQKPVEIVTTRLAGTFTINKEVII